MNHVHKRSRGFTIIELLLAMSFIAALLLLIALTILQIATTYNRGMTLKEVNQAGRLISDDIERQLQASSNFSLATNFFSNGDGGRLCLGQYSYVWNYAGAGNPTNYSNSSDEIHLVKVPDPSGSYCVRNAGAYVVDDVDKTQAVELLKAGDRFLSIHQFAVTPNPASVDLLTGQQLYHVSYTIGTGDVTALNTTRTACLAPGQANSNFAYCAVQQFDLVIRTGNGVN